MAVPMIGLYSDHRSHCVKALSWLVIFYKLASYVHAHTKGNIAVDSQLVREIHMKPLCAEHTRNGLAS